MVEPDQVARRIRHALEGTQNQLNLKRNGRRRLIGVSNRESLQRCRLARHTSNLAKERRIAGAARRRLLKSLIADLCDNITHLLETSNAGGLDTLQRLLACHNVRAVQADDIGKLLNPVKELIQVHRPSQCDVSEMARTELIRVLTGGTDLAILNDAKSSVKDAIRNRLLRLVGLVGGNLHDAPLENVVGVCNAKLNSGNCVAHFTSYTVLCKVFVLPTAHVNCCIPEVVFTHNVSHEFCVVRLH